MRLCSRCAGILENSNARYCRQCRNEYNKQHYKKNPQCRQLADKANKDRIRARIIEAKNRPCMDCGILYPWYVMDFDHVRGVKKILLSVAAACHLSVKKLEDEIAKCDVVCANCHRIRTFQRAGGPTYKTASYELANRG